MTGGRKVISKVAQKVSHFSGADTLPVAAQGVTYGWHRIGGSQPSGRGSIPRGAANSKSGRGFPCHAFTYAVFPRNSHLLSFALICTHLHSKVTQKVAHLCTVSNLRNRRTT